MMKCSPKTISTFSSRSGPASTPHLLVSLGGSEQKGDKIIIVTITILIIITSWPSSRPPGRRWQQLPWSQLPPARWSEEQPLDSLAISLQGRGSIKIVVMLLMKIYVFKMKLPQTRSRPDCSLGFHPLNARLLPHIPCNPQHGQPQRDRRSGLHWTQQVLRKTLFWNHSVGLRWGHSSIGFDNWVFQSGFSSFSLHFSLASPTPALTHRWVENYLPRQKVRNPKHDWNHTFVLQITSILGGVFKEQSSSAFAIFKFMQSLSAAIAFFYSPYLR